MIENIITVLVVALVVIVPLLVIASVGGGVVRCYNKLNGLRIEADEAEANVRVALSKKAELSNRLVDIAGRYAEHEKLIHLRVSDNMAAGTSAMAQVGRQTANAITLVTRLVDKYPKLKADGTFLALMTEIRSVETELQQRRERFNATVRSFNSALQRFPEVLLGGILGFSERDYYR